MKNTSIEWTSTVVPVAQLPESLREIAIVQDGMAWIPGHTFNSWIGCNEVPGDPACAHCYAKALMDLRFHRVEWGGPRRRTSTQYWQAPLRWNQEAEETGIRRKVFCASLADVFDWDVDQGWRNDLWELCEATPNLDKLLVTKRLGATGDREERQLSVRERIDRFLSQIPRSWKKNGFPDHVWLIVTTGTQAVLDRRLPVLKDLPVPIKGLSVEPMLERMNFHAALPGIDWVIFGGESNQISGPARALDVDWMRSGLQQCHEFGVPAFAKQLGDNIIGHPEIATPKGGDPSEWAIDLCVRQYPKKARVYTMERTRH